MSVASGACFSLARLALQVALRTNLSGLRVNYLVGKAQGWGSSLHYV